MEHSHVNTGKTRFFAVLLLALFLLHPARAEAITREDAVSAIGQAELDIGEMRDEGFSVSSPNDSLVAARLALERADFAELIRTTPTGTLAAKARAALQGMNYEGFTYDAVLEHTRAIAERKRQAYAILDAIRAAELKMDAYNESRSMIDTSGAETLLKNARAAFEKERYGEAENLLSAASLELENKKAEITITRVLVRSGQGFIEKNWPQLSAATAVLGAFAAIGWKAAGRRRLQKRLRKLKVERLALTRLMKQNQVARFKNGTISGLAYTVKQDRYNNRLNEIRQTIPVVEAMLKKGQTP